MASRLIIRLGTGGGGVGGGGGWWASSKNCFGIGERGDGEKLRGEGA